MAEVTGSPVAMRIHKKTGSDTYILYHPQTGDSEVLVGTAQWDGTGFIPTTLYNMNGGTATTNSASATWVNNNKSSYPYVKLSEYLLYINNQITSFANVLEFKGVKATYAALGTASAGTVGDVWVVNEAHGTYPAGTLYVGSMNNSTSTTTYSWEPLGGDNSIYALKTQALGSVTYTGSTFTFSYVSGGSATTITIPTIGTVAAGTAAIVNTIPDTGSDNSIPNVAAVRSYASSAGKVTVETKTTGSLIVVSQNVAGTQSVGVVNIAVTSGQDTTPTLAANISGNANTATQVNHTFDLEGRSTSTSTALYTYGYYNGSATVSLRFGVNSFLTSYNTSEKRLSVNILPTHGITISTNGVGVQGSNGITVDSNGVSVKASTGITVTSSGVGIKGAHTISAGTGIAVTGDTSYQGTAKTTTIGLAVSGVSTGVYSALQVDAYGRAVAGAQSLVFAPSLQSADLSALVVGGLAFIGADETGNNSSYSAPSGTVITSSNIS